MPLVTSVTVHIIAQKITDATHVKQQGAKRLEVGRYTFYGHVKRMPEEKIAKLIMEWTPTERRKRGRPRKTWIEGVQAAVEKRNLEPDHWRNREEWSLVSRKTTIAVKKPNGWMDGWIDRYTF